MISTSTPLGTDFPKQIVSLLFNAIDEGTKQAEQEICMTRQVRSLLKYLGQKLIYL